MIVLSSRYNSNKNPCTFPSRCLYLRDPRDGKQVFEGKTSAVIKKTRLLLLDINDNLFSDSRERYREGAPMSRLLMNNFKETMRAPYQNLRSTLNDFIKCVDVLLLTCEVFKVPFHSPPAPFWPFFLSHSTGPLFHVCITYRCLIFPIKLQQCERFQQCLFEKFVFTVNICRSTCVVGKHV